MLHKLSVFLVGIAVVHLLIVSPAIAEEHHDHEHEDIEVGVTSAGQLSWHFDHFDDPIVLAPAEGIWSAVGGWVGSEPGFAAVETDEPDENLYVLADGVAVRLQIVAIDPGLWVWSNDTSESIDSPGQSIPLGGTDLHTHAWWQIAEGAGEPVTLSATFELVDAGTSGYSASAPWTMQFTNVPEPGGLCALGLGAVALLAPMRWRSTDV